MLRLCCSSAILGELRWEKQWLGKCAVFIPGCAPGAVGQNCWTTFSSINSFQFLFGFSLCSILPHQCTIGMFIMPGSFRTSRLDWCTWAAFLFHVRKTGWSLACELTVTLDDRLQCLVSEHVLMVSSYMLTGYVWYIRKELIQKAAYVAMSGLRCGFDPCSVKPASPHTDTYMPASCTQCIQVIFNNCLPAPMEKQLEIAPHPSTVRHPWIPPIRKYFGLWNIRIIFALDTCKL